MIFFSLVMISAVGCAGGGLTNGLKSVETKGNYRIAIFPMENLSGAPAPLEDLRGSLISKLIGMGIALVGEEEMEGCIEKHRIRDMGGLTESAAEVFREEANTDAVLIISLERYDMDFPPKISLVCRLISTADQPTILWTDSIGLSGIDSPGAFGLGIIEAPDLLVEKALSSLADSLASYLSASELKGEVPVRSTFRPRVEYRSLVIRQDREYRVAVLPFQNLSVRKNAGEIVALHFIGQLSRRGKIYVVEPGVIKEEMLAKRIIMSGGVSFADADLLSDYPGVDLVVSGTVYNYEDYVGFGGKPKVDFSAQVIDRTSRELVWASESSNEGDDGVWFFDIGRVNTASAMASEMIGATVEQMMSSTQADHVEQSIYPPNFFLER